MSKSGTPWTEADYRAKGWASLKIRISELAKLRLTELSESTGATRSELVEELIEERYERRGAKDDA